MVKGRKGSGVAEEEGRRGGRLLGRRGAGRGKAGRRGRLEGRKVGAGMKANGGCRISGVSLDTIRPTHSSSSRRWWTQGLLMQPDDVLLSAYSLMALMISSRNASGLFCRALMNVEMDSSGVRLS